MKSTVSAALAIARSEIGVRESGASNRGRRVDEYQRADTLAGEGYSWCASFVGWVLKQASAQSGVEVIWPYSASCDVLLAYARSRELLRSSPEPGDVFLARAQRGDGYSKTDAIHTGLVETVSGKTFTAVEGNTNAGGGREGTSVLRHTRQNTGRYYFARWADLLPDVAAVETPYTVAMMTAGQRVEIPSRMHNGSVLVAARDWADARRQKIAWDADAQAVVIAGTEVPFQPRFFEGRAYFSLRNLCEFAGAAISVDVANRRVEVTG